MSLISYFLMVLAAIYLSDCLQNNSEFWILEGLWHLIFQAALILVITLQLFLGWMISIKGSLLRCLQAPARWGCCNPTRSLQRAVCVSVSTLSGWNSSDQIDAFHVSTFPPGQLWASSLLSFQEIKVLYLCEGFVLGSRHLVSQLSVYVV